MFQFVDSIDASPTVLLDLDDNAPFTVVEGTQMETPDLREQNSYNNLGNGTTGGASTWDDKVFPLTLGINPSTSPEDQLTAIQTLIRLCNTDQWLMVQFPEITNPVFLRTRRSAVKVVDDIIDEHPNRSVTLTVRAEYAAYGLPETGTFTINNDPSAATNPMSHVFSLIKGDVASALSLKFAAASHTVDACMLSSCAAPDAPLTPIFTGTATAPGTTGWSFSGTTTDSTAIGGTTNTLTKASGSNAALTAFTFGSVPLGDYRILARAKTTASEVTLSLTNGSLALDLGTPATFDSSDWQYVDLGVARLPVAQKNSVPPGIAPTVVSAISVGLYVSTPDATGVVSVDTLMAIPVGLDDARASSLLIVGGANSITSPLVIDSEAEEISVTTGNPKLPPVGGAFPAVVPGEVNVVTMIRSLIAADAKTDSLVTNWMYYPRYLYMRPAST